MTGACRLVAHIRNPTPPVVRFVQSRFGSARRPVTECAALNLRTARSAESNP